MIDYVGVSGCIFLPHMLQIFTSIYSLLFPLTVALLRFMFIVCNNWTKWYGTNKLVNTILLLSFSVSLLMTLSLQFPVYDYVHGPFNYCRGRFEVLFNPTHSDREGRQISMTNVFKNLNLKLVKISSLTSICICVTKFELSK
jgi:hypothetical protein